MDEIHAMKYHPDRLKTDFKDHLKSQKLSDATIRYYVSDVRVFLRFIYQTSGDYQITSEIFESYENFLKSGNLPTKTINRKLSSLRIFSAFLLKQGLLKENIMRGVKNNKNSRNSRQFKVTTAPILLVVFFIIVGVGGFIISTTRSDLFFTTNSFTPEPVVISNSIQTDTTHPPELLRSQNLDDIAVDGEKSVMRPHVVAMGTNAISAGALFLKIRFNLNTSTDNVFVMPTAEIQTPYYVEEQKEYFVIHIKEVQKNDITFNWLVISNQFPVDNLNR